MTRHSRNFSFYSALAAGVVVLPVLTWFAPRYAIVGGANVFFVVYLTLAALRLRFLDAAYLRKHAAGADMPAWAIFGVTLLAVAVVVVSLFRLINAHNAPALPELLLSLASVALGWATVHTMAAFHYAHVHWSPEEGSKPGEPRKPRGGLEFPQTPEPTGHDFLYFAFVIGMTAQTSDVVITRTDMRKLNLAHAVVSFFFNTVLVAAAVNLAVSFSG